MARGQPTLDFFAAWNKSPTPPTAASFFTIIFAPNSASTKNLNCTANPNRLTATSICCARGARTANGPAGAVLKSWVESRFGLLATFHKGRLADDRAAREALMLDRTRGAAKSIGALMQLDLLYTFCQDELRRRFPDEKWKTLYRGTHDSEEYTVQTRTAGAKRAALVQLNNLSSFTSDPEVAWEFGSSAWEVKVPFAKIVFFSGLLPKSCLAGESEHLVLGGYYNVRGMLC